MPHGLFDFELACTHKGQSADVTLYLDTPSHVGWTWRKFNRFGLTYATVGERAKFGTVQIGSHTVTTVAYSITDGNNLDEDGKANGIILDPAGPGIQTATWSWKWGLLLLPVIIVVGLLIYKQRR